MNGSNTVFSFTSKRVRPDVLIFSLSEKPVRGSSMYFGLFVMLACNHEYLGSENKLVLCMKARN